MANVLDFVEPGPLLSDEVLKPPIVSKATVQRCISMLLPQWDDEQLEAVVSMFKAHGLRRGLLCTRHHGSSDERDQ